MGLSNNIYQFFNTLYTAGFISFQNWPAPIENPFSL